MAGSFPSRRLVIPKNGLARIQGPFKASLGPSPGSWSWSFFPSDSSPRNHLAQVALMGPDEYPSLLGQDVF